MHIFSCRSYELPAIYGGPNEVDVTELSRGLMSLVMSTVSKARRRNVDKDTPRGCARSAQYGYWKVKIVRISGREPETFIVQPTSRC